jgi:hypothetical protein
LRESVARVPGWDEGDKTGFFYSPLHNPLQQERWLSVFATYCFYYMEKLCRYHYHIGDKYRRR